MYYFNYTYLGMDVPTVILLMLIYSFIGWIYESTVFSLAEQGKFMNRGCFIGPYCPIYGVACMFSLYLLNGITSGFKIVLIAGLVVSAIEYVTSVVLEKLFHARYWDYSYFPLNINGRVCLDTIIPFGLLGVLITYVTNPFFLNGLDSEVLSVYTEEEYRGKGICTSLMSNMIEYAREHQICRIDLVATDEGYPIYKKLGFEDKVQKYTDMRLKL